MENNRRSTGFGRSPGQTLAVLHPAFALTGICHAIGGPLLPSLAPAFHLNDSQAGLLLFCYFGGTSLGALLCGPRHARTLTFGFFALAAAALAVSVTSRILVYPLFLLFGVCVGAPMTAVSMYVGHTFGGRSAAPLTFLNFSWSAGALLAPLLAARLLVHHTFRAAYVMLACAALVAAIACWLQLEDAPEIEPLAPSNSSRLLNLRFIALFALLTFLQVGVENTTASWLATYVLRTARSGAAWAAAATSFYWAGFLASRGLSSLLLLRLHPERVLRASITIGIVAGVGLLAMAGTSWHVVAMVVLGAALAPIFPLLLARFFADARSSSDSRWVLALCGFGGSVLPWFAGSLSAQTGSLGVGLIVIPAALLVILCALPLMGARRNQANRV
jgi:FHS family L-fucose permease-like MFS transporter